MFIVMTNSNTALNDDVKKGVIALIRKNIGPIATPSVVHIVSDLPKTRSGKIMRRILRKIEAGEKDSIGDVSTLAPYTTRSDCFQAI